jgi:hypothetical protein
MGLACWNTPLLRFAALLVSCLGAAAAMAATAQGADAAAADTSSAAALRARYAQLQPRLANNPFGKPLYLESRDSNGELKGDVYAVLEHPFTTVDALEKSANWCDLLILPFNTKHCEAGSVGYTQMLTVYVGKKSSDSLDRAFRLDFKFNPVARTADYLKRTLRSDAGPMGTRNYDITLEATPLDAKSTFLHLSYSYNYGTISRIAMQTYLSTVGAGKVGFTSSNDDGGKNQLVSGMRGVMERNTMRYFLAIEAYLDSLTAPPASQLTKRINDWFTASERYPRQLHEMDRGEYVALKQKEAQRPRSAS